MSSELQKQINTSAEKEVNLFNAQVINFPKEKEIKQNQTLRSEYIWEIRDKSNKDQLKAVTGICFMLGALVLMGLYSNLL
tara:strand:+ start:35 stop:274 length:240 start_codon:yes stop_codon:yes gene_type:complete